MLLHQNNLLLWRYTALALNKMSLSFFSRSNCNIWFVVPVIHVVPEHIKVADESLQQTEQFFFLSAVFGFYTVFTKASMANLLNMVLHGNHSCQRLDGLAWFKLSDRLNIYSTICIIFWLLHRWSHFHNLQCSTFLYLALPSSHISSNPIASKLWKG